MAWKCDRCGKELEFAEVRTWDGPTVCDACLAGTAEPQEQPVAPAPLSLSGALDRLPGNGLAGFAGVFAFFVMLAAVITGVGLGISLDSPTIAVSVIAGGIFCGVLLLGLTMILDLLRVIAARLHLIEEAGRGEQPN